MATAPPGGLLRRNPDFARLYFAALISFAGDWFTWVALQGLILEETGSPALAGLMLATAMLPFALVAPIAGVIADRVDRKKLMIVADVLRAFVALGLLLARSQSTIWIAFVCNALLSALAPFFEPASSAALPNLVRTQDLARANVLMGSAWGTMVAVGAALGGVVAATLGRDAAFILDALSFALSAALIATIRGRFRERDRLPQEHHVTVVEDIRIAVRFARSEPRVKAILVVKALFGLGAGPIALISIMAVQVFHKGDTGIGILMGARGVGALIGPFLWRKLIVRGHDERLLGAIGAATAFYAVCYTLFAGAPNIWLAAVAVAAAHVGGGANWTMSAYALQRFTPDDVRGRVFSFDYAIITLAMSMSFSLAGAAAGQINPRTVVLISTAMTLGGAALWTSWAHRLTRRSQQTTG